VGEGSGREVTDLLPAPRERTDTLPQGLPERTLGYHAAAWMMDNLIQPNGPRAGQPFIPTDRQITFLAHFYALNHKGNFVYRQGIRRLAKGSGKSPFAAAMCLFELLGPCRYDGFDRHEPFGVRAKPMSMPLVQVVAVSESQTANTMRMVRAFCQKKGPLARKYDLDPGKTFIETPAGGNLFR